MQQAPILSIRHFQFLTILLFLLLLPPSLMAADIHVDDDTCPATGSGTPSDPYCKINDAINAASSGDTVLVHPGTYSETQFPPRSTITMVSGINVIAAETEKPVIRPGRNLVVFKNVSDCTLDGFVLDGSGSGMARVALATVENASNVAIRNCEIKGDLRPRTGIRLNGQVDVVISGNYIHDFNYAGITSKWVGTVNNSTITITNNTIERCGRAGIYLAGADNTENTVVIGGNDAGSGNLIRQNGLADKGSGIRLLNITHTVIANNTIEDNSRAGILLIDTTTTPPHITSNTIRHNGRAGINIGGASALTIGDSNEIYENGLAGIAFFVERNNALLPTNIGKSSSMPVTIRGNAIHQNTKAGIAVIDVVTGPITVEDNDIYDNTRAGISFFASCNATINGNSIHGHTGAAGIFTGDWSGTNPPDPTNPPTTVAYLRSSGPVNLTIKRNRIFENYAGMRLDHASGVITNNIIYNNTLAGIRYSGSASEPFGMPWGISLISNNTVVSNGSYIAADDQNKGAGIVFDDITITIDDDTGEPRQFNDKPLRNKAKDPIVIKNNIAAWNKTTGIRDCVCSTIRDYNLYYANFGKLTFVPAQTGGCASGTPPFFTGNPHEIFADPKFENMSAGDFRLRSDSPGKGAGDDRTDIGAYGGSDPIN